MAKESIIIVGTGWAGYTVSEQLNDKKFDITIISPQDTLPYTPLLASAAVGLFDFSLAEEPVRRKSKRQEYYQARVESIDFVSKICKCRGVYGLEGGEGRLFDVSYDRLILAPGCITNTFGTPGADEHALFVRNVADAKKVQSRIKQLLELASLPGITEQQQRNLLHIAVIGGGPTGVELSAEFSDLCNEDFPKLYPHLEGKFAITIYDAASFILGDFEESLREHAIGSFSKRHVQVITGCKIKEVTRDSITTEAEGHTPCGMVLWTAGNKQCALVDALDVCKTDKLPRIMTDDFLRVLKTDKTPMQDVFALGDAADIKKYFLPTTAEVAIQKAKYLATVLNTDSFDKSFGYSQKPLVAYIGGHDGVVKGNPDWTGTRAWTAWRSKNLLWTKSWRRKVMITAYWLLGWIGGTEMARA